MPGDPIGDLWAFWAESQSALVRSIEKRERVPTDVFAGMSAGVQAVGAGLGWQIGKGAKLPHRLCLSAGDKPALRVAAERWYRRAPATTPSTVWEYLPARPAAAKPAALVLRFGADQLAFADFAYGLVEDTARAVLDVTAFHPAWRVVEEAARADLIAVALWDLLGEDDVARWIGAMKASDVPPAGPTRPADLRKRVAALRAGATGARWTERAGKRDGKPRVAVVDGAVKRVDHLLLDVHIEVALPLSAPLADGLASPAELASLRPLEDELVAAVGLHGLLLARETTAGLRRIHVRAAADGPARGLAEQWAARRADRRAAVTAAEDPGWERALF